MNPAELRQSLFDSLPPVWILSRECTVHDANASARAATEAGLLMCLLDGRLSPAIYDGGRRLAAVVAALHEPTYFGWPDRQGREAGVDLRPISDGRAVVASLILAADPAQHLAPGLAQRLGLPPRQSQVAAHLASGRSLTDVARLLGISRATAAGHLDALQRRFGHSNRSELILYIAGLCRYV